MPAKVTNIAVANLFTTEPFFQNFVVEMHLGAPAAPSLSSVAGGTLAATTLFVKLTYVDAAGESQASSEASLALTVDHVLHVASPAAAGDATGYNVYVGTSTGTETKQNASPIAIGTDWQEPTSGLIAGAALPTTSTARVGVVEPKGNWDSTNSRFLQDAPVYFRNAIIGTTYSFRVAVADKYGNLSAWSAWITDVAGDSTAPTQTYSASAVQTAGGIRVSAGPVSPSSDTDHYDFFWNTTNTAPTSSSLPNLPPSNDATAHIVISGSEDAFVWVRAVDTSGNEQAWASLGGFTSTGSAILSPPTTAPGAPTGLTTVAGQGEFFFSWSAPTGATNLSLLSYTLQTATDSGFTTNVVTYPNLSLTAMQVHKPASTLFWRVNAQYPNSPAGAWANFGAPTSVTSGLIGLDADVVDGDGAGGGTYQRMPIVNMDVNRRALIDFTQAGHLSKNLDNIGDTSNYVRGAQNSGSAIALDNANFVAGTSGWVAFSSATISQVSSSPFTNGKALQVSTADQFLGAQHVRTFKANPGDQFFMSCWVKSDGTFQAKVELAYLDGSGAFLGSDGAFSTSTSWTQISFTGTAPANTATIQVILIRADAGGLTQICQFTNPHLVRIASLDNEVADGATFVRIGNVNADHTFHVSTALNNQASVVGSPAASPSYTSTTTSITWSWGAFTVYFPDGSTLAVSAGSQGFSGLTANTTYYFEFYVVKSAGTMTCVMSDNSTAPASVQFLAQTVGADGHAIEITDITAATPASGTGGGSGSGGTCFSGDTKIKTDKGFIRMDELPAKFNIVNQTGLHRALRIVHTYRDDELLVMPNNGLVTPGHMMQKGESWVPASELFSEKAPAGTRTLYDIQVVTGKPEDMHYILENGYVAHNKSRVSCFDGEARVLTAEGWIRFKDLPEKFQIVNSKGIFDGRLFQHQSSRTNPPRMRLLPDGGTVTDDHIVRPLGEADWRHAEELLPTSTNFPETVYNIISDGGYYRVGNLEARALEGNN